MRISRYKTTITGANLESPIGVQSGALASAVSWAFDSTLRQARDRWLTVGYWNVLDLKRGSMSHLLYAEMYWREYEPRQSYRLPYHKLLTRRQRWLIDNGDR